MELSFPSTKSISTNAQYVALHKESWMRFISSPIDWNSAGDPLKNFTAFQVDLRKSLINSNANCSLFLIG